MSPACSSWTCSGRGRPSAAIRAGAGASSDPLEVCQLAQVRLAAFPAESVPLPALGNYGHITIEREAEYAELLKTKHKADLAAARKAAQIKLGGAAARVAATTPPHAGAASPAAPAGPARPAAPSALAAPAPASADQSLPKGSRSKQLAWLGSTKEGAAFAEYARQHAGSHFAGGDGGAPGSHSMCVQCHHGDFELAARFGELLGNPGGTAVDSESVGLRRPR